MRSGPVLFMESAAVKKGGCAQRTDRFASGLHELPHFFKRLFYV